MRSLSIYIICLFLFKTTSEAQQVFHLPQLPAAEIMLTGWKMFTGDDPRFADPAFNDSSWEPVDLSKDIQQFPAFRKAGIIWVRLHLSIDSNVARQQLVAHITQYSASEIYLNGKLIKKYGTIGADPKNVIAWLPSALPFDLDLIPGANNVIAARLAYQKGIPYISYLNEALPALNIYIDNKENAVKNYEASQWQTKIYIIIFGISSGTLLIIGFIYLVYFFFDRKQQLHLYYALAMLAQCLNALPVEVWGTDRFGAIERLMWVFLFEAAAYTLGLLFIVLTIYTIFGYPYRLLFKILSFVSIFLIAGIYWYGTYAFFLVTYVFPAIYLFAGTYACGWAIKQNKKHAGIILVGIIIYTISTLLSAFIPINSTSAQLLFYITQMGFPIGMSFYLAIQSSITNKKLRTSLEEIQTLSEKSLAQEKEKQQLLSNQNELLEQQVQERTAELNQSLIDLKATQSQLVQSEKMASLGELTAGIAHEIQNPLNFVNNFSEVNSELIKELKNEVIKGDMEEVTALANDIESNSEKINHHGKRAGDIVKGMLQHSRTSSGQKESTDINALTDEYLRLAYHGLKAKDKNFTATLKTDFDKTIDKINIIPQDTGRVILNLLTNAFYAVAEKKKQTNEGYDPVVAVSTTKANGKVEISVKDNGNGIPQNIIDKIFQPFFTTKPTGQGTGLGLSLAYDIVKAHGGELKATTKEGEGSIFIISLPA
ncbi:MAG: ATP-binding protein [Ferruginibacter sp.]